MSRKKGVKREATKFIARADALILFVESVNGSGLSAQDATWAVEGALIKLAAGFEQLMLHSLVGAVNNDTSSLTAITGVTFPRHMTDEVCEYLVTGGRYFDFRGRDGLIKTLRQYLLTTHYLVQDVSNPARKQSLDRVIALRNFAAHESVESGRMARAATGTRMSAAGAWLKRQGRFRVLALDLRQLAVAINSHAPY